MLNSSLLSPERDAGAASNSGKLSFLSQRKTVPAVVYYGLVALAIVSTVTFVLLCVGWALRGSASSSAPLAPPVHSSAQPTAALSSALVTSDGGAAPGVVQEDEPNSLTPKSPQYPSSTLVGQVKSYTLLHLLSGLYEVAMVNGGNRAIQNPGFNATIEFLLDQIARKTVLVNVEKSYFVRAASFAVTGTRLTASGAGLDAPLSFTHLQDWRVYLYSASSKGETVQLLPVKRGGCESRLYQQAMAGRQAAAFWFIVDRLPGCPDNHRIGWAQQFGARGILLRGHRDTAVPIAGQAANSTAISVVSITHAAAAPLVEALERRAGAVYLSATFTAEVLATTIANICADTPGGDTTSVVLVGGHSDGVARGPGVNDDGSGSISTLALAIGMSRLLSNATANWKNVNMVKFCWFGGEEQGLWGSQDVVRVGKLRDADPNARAGSRLKDWAVMIDLDMLGSLNFQNWVYDANVYIPPSTPQRAWNGSKIQTDLFFEYFDTNSLPRDSDRFDGRSDYGPFLSAGVPAGGVDAGADKRKTEAQRLRYQAMTGWGGVTNAINDQCYHQACDHIGNIQWGVYTNMTQSAAYVLEVFAQKQNLRQYLGNPLLDGLQDDENGLLPLDFRVGPDVRNDGTDEGFDYGDGFYSY